MATKKSVVKSVQPNGTWEGKFGVMYKHDVEFENGDIGEYSSKKQEQEKFIVGEDTDYEFTDGQYPKVKPIWEQPKTNYAITNSPDTEQHIIRSVALKAAAEYNATRTSVTTDEVLADANRFEEFIKNGFSSDNVPF